MYWCQDTRRFVREKLRGRGREFGRREWGRAIVIVRVEGWELAGRGERIRVGEEAASLRDEARRRTKMVSHMVGSKVTREQNWPLRGTEGA